jgi:hypothetical protein
MLEDNQASLEDSCVGYSSIELGRYLQQVYGIHTRCIQNQIKILKYPSSAASERLSDKIIFKDWSKME